MWVRVRVCGVCAIASRPSTSSTPPTAWGNAWVRVRVRAWLASFWFGCMPWCNWFRFRFRFQFRFRFRFQFWFWFRFWFWVKVRVQVRVQVRVKVRVEVKG